MKQVTPQSTQGEFFYGFSVPWTILAGFTSAFLFYEIFFMFSEQIWGYYFHVDPMTLTPSIRLWVSEHDGIEAYVLYAFSFIGMGLTAILSLPIVRPDYYPIWSLNLARKIGCLIGAFFFFYYVGFHPRAFHE